MTFLRTASLTYEDMLAREKGAGWTMRTTHVHDGNGLLAGVSKIFNHVLDEHRLFGDGALYDTLVG